MNYKEYLVHLGNDNYAWHRIFIEGHWDLPELCPHVDHLNHLDRHMYGADDFGGA